MTITRTKKERQRTKRIHINQHNIKYNKAHATDEIPKPVITVKTYKDNVYGHQVKIKGPCTVIYQPNNPLPCGAHVWIETQEEVVVFEQGKGVTANL